MENDMLRDVPVALQNSKPVQEEIRKKVEKLYKLKKKGDKIILREKEDDYEYNKNLELLKEGKFNDVSWIYPVVS